LNKKFVIVIISLLSTILLASEATKALNLAKSYEKDGNIKKAMEQYKKAALILSKPMEKSEKNQKILTYGNNSIESYEDKKTDETVEQIIYSAFDIEAYRMNYLLPLTYDSKNHTNHDSHSNRKKVETKFQISLKKKLSENLFGLNERLYLGYTQTSWWQTAADSSPFRETNYEPEVFIDFPFESTQSPLKLYRIGIVHQSNGRLSQSRSWNRIYASGIFQYHGIFFQPRIWYRFQEDEKTGPTDFDGDDNPDILDYLGYGDITISYPYQEHLFSSIIRKRSIQLDWTFPLFGLNDVYGYIQVFNGYGESLVDYNEKVNKIGFGFSLTR
jgi:phospholipase A1